MDFHKEFKEMLDAWGEDAQINICIEEMAELTMALCKYLRHKRFGGVDPDKAAKNLENIREEIADTLNCVTQMQYIFGEREVDDIRVAKVKRTMEKLKKI